MENGHAGKRHNVVEGTSRPLSTLYKSKLKGFQNNSKSEFGLTGSMVCTGRLWSFFVLGAALFIVAVVTTGLYFNIRVLTTSLEYAEVLPTYVPAASMAISGCCVMFIFWKRITIVVILSIICCMTTALINLVATVLTGTHVIQVMQTLTQCRYYGDRRVCHCLSPYTRSNLDLSYTEDLTAYIFEDADDCVSIHDTLLQIVYGLCAGYSAAVFLCIAATILCAIVIKMEKNKDKLQKDTYEEVYTVSGGSSVTSDSDHEQQQQQTLPPVSCPAHSLGEQRAPTMGLRRSHSLSQPPQSRMEESMDNLMTDTSIESSAAAAHNKQKRRRHKRAMTLHNLDSKQLMLILSLQMRYLQETENLRESRNQSAPTNASGRKTPVAIDRRTPNPQMESRPTAPVAQNIRTDEHVGYVTHTPRVRSRSAMGMETPQDASHVTNQLPNTPVGYIENIPSHIPDIPRYVSLPKLPRRSQTPQTTSVSSRGNPSSVRIASSTSDPNITQHARADAPSKSGMLVQRRGQGQRLPEKQQSYQHARSAAIPGRERTQVYPSYPTRIKTPDGNYAQISSYQRSRTPSNASSSSGMGSRPLPPVRSVSCSQNTMRRSHDSSTASASPMESHPRQPSNYVELTYATRTEASGDESVPEGLYSNPSKTPQILLNDMYVDLYPVQENNSSNSSSNNTPRPAPPAPPPYPPFLQSGPQGRVAYARASRNSPRPNEESAMYAHLNGFPYPAQQDAGPVRDYAHSPQTQNQVSHGQRRNDNLPPPPPPSQFDSQPYVHQNGHTREYVQKHYRPKTPQPHGGPGHRSEHLPPPPSPLPHHGQSHLTEQMEDFPPPPPLPHRFDVHDSGNYRQQHRQFPGSSSHAFRPIDDVSRGQCSPPVCERPGHQVALVLHNSDGDSDSDFMETVI